MFSTTITYPDWTGSGLVADWPVFLATVNRFILQSCECFQDMDDLTWLYFINNASGDHLEDYVYHGWWHANQLADQHLVSNHQLARATRDKLAR
jgi:hypothetical protein